MEKILVALVAVVAYPLMWLTNSIQWCAEKVRVPPFYIVAFIVVLPMWVMTFAEFMASDNDLRSSYLDLIILGVGGLFLAYVIGVSILGLLFVSASEESSGVSDNDEEVEE